MAGRTAGVCLVLALCIAVAAAQAPTYTAASPFDWGRPCTLLGSSAAPQITGPNNAACTSCGSGATATPEPTCTFKSLTYPVGSTIYIKYHSSVHDLYLGSKACEFTTNVCPNATSEEVSATKPCSYTFKTAGSYYISDKAGTGNGYCKDYGASLPITVSTSS